MCGVAGVYAYHPNAPQIDREELIKIRDHMASRGPDGKGEWYSSDGRVGLGHRRLSIIDLSDKASQPMVTEDEQFVISFNGEIYNYKSIRKKLEQKGYRFHSNSDTEVLLHLYADKGEAMVHDLRGMYAFTLWDKKKRAMFLVRDPYGIKPLYYADDGYTLRLASQVKAIMASDKISRQEEPAGIVGFYLFGSVPEPYTIYQNIRSVPAGSYLWVDSSGPGEPIQYFSISRIWVEAEQENLDGVDIFANIRDALLDSIRHHMVSDVPVGAFLSAGVDSGALVGLMTDVMKDMGGGRPIQTITLAFNEFRGRHEDESPLAEQVAAQYHTDHTTRVITQEEFEEDLPLIIDAMDQPSIDGINTWFVSKAAKEQGLKVAISGLGGDELFGGYGSFRDIPHWVRLMKIPSKVPFLGDLVRIIGEQMPEVFGIHPKAWGLIKYGGTYSGAWLLKRGLFMPWELKQVLDQELVEQGLKKLQPLKHIGETLKPLPVNPFGNVSSLESSLYMRNQLLRDADWAGMAHSIEIRLPLVDVCLLKNLAGILSHQKKIKDKQWLGDSPSSPLPLEIIERNKTGFTTPISEWIKDSHLSSVLLKGNQHWSRSWAQTLGRQ